MDVGATPVSDRRIIETLVAPGAMLVLFRSIRSGIPDGADVLDPIIERLSATITAPLDDVPPEKRRKLTARSTRTLNAVFDVLSAPPVPTYRVQWTAVAKLLCHLSQQDRLLVVEGSDFDQAWEAMSSMVLLGNPGPDEEAATDELAARLLEKLQSIGLFTD